MTSISEMRSPSGAFNFWLIGFVLLAAVFAAGVMTSPAAAQEPPDVELVIEESITVSDTPGSVTGEAVNIDEGVRVRDLITAIPQERPGPAPRVITKRGFIGHVVGLSGDSVTVRSDGQSVILLVDGQTEINAPPDMDVGVDALSTDPASRVAVFADRVPDDDPVIALRITVIPSEATRQHTRVVLTGVAVPGRLAAVDANGNEINLIGPQDPDAKAGDSLVVLFQGNIDTGDIEIIGSVRSDEVDERLDEFVDDEEVDPIKKARLLDLRDDRDLDEKTRLDTTASNTSGETRLILLDRIEITEIRIEEREDLQGAGERFIACSKNAINRWRAGNPRFPALTDAGVIAFSALTAEEQDQIAQDCGSTPSRGDVEPPQVTLTAPSTGSSVTPGSTVTVIAEATDNVEVVSVAFNVNGEGRLTDLLAPYRLEVIVPDDRTSLDIEATARDAAGNTATDAIFFSVDLSRPTRPTVAITSPDSTVTEGESIVLSAEASDDGEVVSVVFTANGTQLRPDTTAPFGVEYTVPAGITSLDILATATDDSGNTAEDSVFVNVRPAAAQLTIQITSPTPDFRIVQGDTVVIKASTGVSDSPLGVVFTVNGERSEEQKSGVYSYSYTVPSGAPAVPGNPSSLPPNFFVGSVTLDGAQALDGTVITVFIEGVRVDTLEVEATVTNDAGQSATDSLSVAVFGAPVNVGETTVSGGDYSIQISQPINQSYAGKVLTFKVNGRDAAESATWQQGGADVLNLTVN